MIDRKVILTFRNRFWDPRGNFKIFVGYCVFYARLIEIDETFYGEACEKMR